MKNTRFIHCLGLDCLWRVGGLLLAGFWAVASALGEVDGDWIFSYSDSDYTATITGYGGTSTTPSVPSKVSRRYNTGEKDEDGEYIYRTHTYQVTALYATFKNNKDITVVSLPPSITNIGHSSFYNCSSLQSLSFNGTISAVGVCAFYDCVKLEGGIRCVEMHKHGIFRVWGMFKLEVWRCEVFECYGYWF